LRCAATYVVVTGWRAHVMATLDTLSSQRGRLDDRLGLQAGLLAAVKNGSLPFVELVGSTRMPAVARVHALHMLWHRRLCIDLAAALTDRAAVSVAGVGGGW
jgi:hypothetical protein